MGPPSTPQHNRIAHKKKKKQEQRVTAGRSKKTSVKLQRSGNRDGVTKERNLPTDRKLGGSQRAPEVFGPGKYTTRGAAELSCNGGT